MRFDSLIMSNNKTVNGLINIGDRKIQDEFLEEYTDYLFKHNIRPFHSLDRFLLLKPDGSISDLQHIFGYIDSASVYDNYFEGVLSIDVTELLNPCNEFAAQYFCEHISDPKYRDHATIILFVSDFSLDETNRFERRLDRYLKVKRIDSSSIM